MPSSRIDSSGAAAGVENACTPRPGSTRTTFAAHALPVVSWSPVSATRGIAASTVQPAASRWTATNHFGSPEVVRRGPPRGGRLDGGGGDPAGGADGGPADDGQGVGGERGTRAAGPGRAGVLDAGGGAGGVDAAGGHGAAAVRPRRRAGGDEARGRPGVAVTAAPVISGRSWRRSCPRR